MAGDDKAGAGHPLPASEEARTDELPEHLLEEKGEGDDSKDTARPDRAVAPDGESYETKRDQAVHQDRGQSFIEAPDRG